MDERYKRLSFFFTKYSDIYKKIWVTCGALVLVTELNVLKQTITNILVFMEQKKLLFGIELEKFRVGYSLLRQFSIVIFLACICIFVVYFILRPILEKISQPQPSTSFEESLNRYLDNKTDFFSKKGYLVSGEWGSGKTHLVLDYFDKFLMFSKRPIYNISCFGLDSRELVLQEIETQIELKDNSLINWIQFIPLIGLPIFNILRKTYSLQNVSSDSIFIFDDFERITPSGLLSETEVEKYDRKEISIRGSNFSVEPEPREFQDVNSEFNKIQNIFENKFLRDNNNLINFNLQKYNVVTGLINELVEKRNARVIIICNTDIIGNNYMDKVFRGKLDCLTYHKSADKGSLSSIFKKSLKNQVFINKERNEILLKEMEIIIQDFEKNWLSSGTNNLRGVKSIFQAFLDTLSELEKCKIFDEKDILSLFYSIYIISFSIENLDLTDYERFPIGGNLSFYLELSGKTVESNLLNKSSYYRDIKWMGVELSGYWLLNFSKPVNIEKIIRGFNDYSYSYFESNLLDLNGEGLEDIENVLLEHFLFIVKKDVRTSLEERSQELEIISKQFRDYIPKLLPKSEDLTESTKKLLLSIDKITGGVFNGRMVDVWLNSIFCYSKIMNFESEREDHSYILTRYNSLVTEKHDNSNI